MLEWQAIVSSLLAALTDWNKTLEEKWIRSSIEVGDRDWMQAVPSGHLAVPLAAKAKRSRQAELVDTDSDGPPVQETQSTKAQSTSSGKGLEIQSNFHQ